MDILRNYLERISFRPPGIKLSNSLICNSDDAVIINLNFEDWIFDLG